MKVVANERLRVEALDVSYGESLVLRNVSLDVRPGEVLCLLGRNGVGKTTLLKTIMGLLRPDAGRISVDGCEMSGRPVEERARRGVAYVPQGREIFPALSVHENLMVAAQAVGLKRVPDDAYDLFPNLKTMTRRRGGDLSGGQQQQLAVSRALLAKPNLLLLDEPTEGIQPSIIDEIEDAIARIVAPGTLAVLLVEQYLQFAQRVGHRYAVMQRGQIVAAGAFAELNVDSVHRYLTV
jgi:urea transport system ATP-binding protein